jgi:hypothetical protein
LGERLLIADSGGSKMPVTVETLQGQLDLIAEALDSSGDGFAIWKLAPEATLEKLSLVPPLKCLNHFLSER